MRMYDVDGKLFNRIKSMYVDSLAGVRVKGGENIKNLPATEGHWAHQGCWMSTSVSELKVA